MECIRNHRPHRGVYAVPFPAGFVQLAPAVAADLNCCNRSITIRPIFSVRPLPEFTEWLEGLPDAAVQGVVVARIKRLALGLMGDVEPVGERVSELRIHVGAGWRVYFVRRGLEVVVLLAGGSKRTQKTDIKRAKVLAARLD